MQWFWKRIFNNGTKFTHLGPICMPPLPWSIHPLGIELSVGYLLLYKVRWKLCNGGFENVENFKVIWQRLMDYIPTCTYPSGENSLRNKMNRLTDRVKNGKIGRKPIMPRRLSKKRDCPRKVPFVMICYLPTAFKVTLLHRFESSLKTDDDMLFTHRFQSNITS